MTRWDSIFAGKKKTRELPKNYEEEGALPSGEKKFTQLGKRSKQSKSFRLETSRFLVAFCRKKVSPKDGGKVNGWFSARVETAKGKARGRKKKQSSQAGVRERKEVTKVIST